MSAGRLRLLNKNGANAGYMRSLLRAANRDAGTLIVDFLGLLIISAEVTIVGLTISWANLEGANAEIGKPATPIDAMTATLMWATFSQVLIHVLGFFYRACKARYVHSYSINIDLLMAVAMCIAQGLWMRWGGFEMPSPIQQTSMVRQLRHLFWAYKFLTAFVSQPRPAA